MKSVKVIVLGSVDSGKSTVAELIADMLSKEFDCKLVDDNYPHPDPDLLARRIALRDAGLSISVEPVQLNRGMFDKDLSEVSVREILNSTSGI